MHCVGICVNMGILMGVFIECMLKCCVRILPCVFYCFGGLVDADLVAVFAVYYALVC